MAYAATASHLAVTAGSSNLGRLTANYRRWWRLFLLGKGRLFTGPWHRRAPAVHAGDFSGATPSRRAKAAARVAQRDALVKLHLGRDVQQPIHALLNLGVDSGGHRSDPQGARGQQQILH